jgi:uncharacterized protein (TIGR02231 family)
MKQTLNILAIAMIKIFSVLNSNAQVNEISTESSIQEVTVFLENAQITRKAKLNLQAGSNIIKLVKLSPYIIPSSIQVAGNNSFTISSVNHRNNYFTSTEDNPEIKKLTQKLEHIENEILTNQAMINTYMEEKNLYNDNKVFLGKKNDMIEFYANRYTEVNKKILDLTLKQEDLILQKNNLKNQLNSLKNSYNINQGEIILNVNANTKTQTEIIFSYVVTHAHWRAAYDIKATDIKSPIELTYKAKVTQSCGEDWNQVKLILSTGNPAKNNNKPVLGIWALSGYSSSGYDKKRKTGRYSDKAYSQADDLYNVKNELSEVVIETKKMKNKADKTISSAEFTTENQTTVSTEFSITIPYSIKSDGKEYTVEIQKNQLQSDYSYYAAPKYDKNAYLIAGIINWEQYNLISGWANTYFTDSYIGRSYIDPKQTEDTLSISLGRDKSVFIERKKIKDYTQRAGGSSKKITIGIEINIRNTKSTPVNLELEDQIPVSKQKDIEVELLEKNDAKYKKEDGSLIWNISLAPGEGKKIKFVYSIKYPKDKELSNF